MADVYEGDRPYIFVSYAHADDDVVLPIIEAFDAAGYRVWFDEGVEWASEWPENIANHLYACSRFLSFMSRAAAVSDNCGDEVYYALNNRKPMLVAYIDDVQLGEVNRGLDMRLAKRQAKRRRDYSSDEAFVGDLLRAKILEPCLRDEYLQRREARREALKIAKSALSESVGDEQSLREALLALRSLPEDERDGSVERYANSVEGRLRQLAAERRAAEEQRRREEEVKPKAAEESVSAWRGKRCVRLPRRPNVSARRRKLSVSGTRRRARQR